MSSRRPSREPASDQPTAPSKHILEPRRSSHDCEGEAGTLVVPGRTAHRFRVASHRNAFHRKVPFRIASHGDDIFSTPRHSRAFPSSAILSTNYSTSYSTNYLTTRRPNKPTSPLAIKNHPGRRKASNKEPRPSSPNSARGSPHPIPTKNKSRARPRKKVDTTPHRLYG